MKKQTKDQEIQAENAGQAAPDVKEEKTAPGKGDPQAEQDRGKPLAEAAASFAGGRLPFRNGAAAAPRKVSALCGVSDSCVSVVANPCFF